ncbi:MAG: glycosyltransferase [Promethearchaeota archaeon]
MKRKILLLIPSLEIGGGAEKVAASLTKTLVNRYDVSIITFYDSQEIYSFSGKYFSLKLKLKTWKKILLPFKIQKLIKSISPDLIISFLEHTSFLMILIKFMFQIKIPLIACSHTNPELAFKGKKKYMNFLIQILYKSNLVNKIITVSKEIQNLFENNYNIKKNKIKTIYNGINLNEIKELTKDNVNHKDLFENSDLVKFISIGRLVELKGHKYLINAFSKVKEDLPNSKLIIIGEGNSRKEIEKLIKQKNLVRDVFLFGLVENPYIYLSKSDIFVLASKYEVFPMVLLEALACGLPIISTNCKTGPREILNNGQYGILAKVMDSDDLADKMTNLAKDKGLREKYTKKSLERSRTFDINNISEEWFNLIDSNIG